MQLLDRFFRGNDSYNARDAASSLIPFNLRLNPLPQKQKTGASARFPNSLSIAGRDALLGGADLLGQRFKGAGIVNREFRQDLAVDLDVLQD